MYIQHTSVLVGYTHFLHCCYVHVLYLKICIAVLNRNISLGLLQISIRDTAHFQEWLNPGRNKFIPGTARNCPGVVTPLKWTRNKECRAPKARCLLRLGGLGERRKLPQWGLGRSPSRQRILEHSRSNEASFGNIFK